MSTNTGDLYVNIRADITELKKGLNTATTEMKKFGRGMEKNAKANKSFFDAFGKRKNDMVRHVRQLETIAVAAAALAGTYKALIGTGLELNKQYQDQSLGIAAVISAKTEMIDQAGQELSVYEKFITTQSITKDVMDDIKEAALETPASFQQMVGFYQQAIGHAMTANGTFGDSLETVNENVISMTQGMSALGSSMGMEMTKINEEIRSLMSGNASTDSLLASILFGSPADANQAVKDAKTRTNGLSELVLTALEPFKEVQSVMTYSKAVARLGASFEELQKGITAEFFDDLTYGFVDLKEKLDGGMDGFIQDWVDVYNEAKAFFDVTLDAIAEMGREFGNIFDLITGSTEELDVFKAVAVTISTVFKIIAKVIGGIYFTFLKMKEVAQAISKAAGIGDYADGATPVMSPRDLLRLEAAQRASESSNEGEAAQGAKDLARLKVMLDKKYGQATALHQQKIKEQEEQLTADIKAARERMNASIDVGDIGDQFDATRDANNYIRGMRDSYKGVDDLAAAYVSLADATQAAVEAANEDPKLLKRIGIEYAKLEKAAKGYFKSREATVKMVGKVNKDEEKDNKAKLKALKELTKATEKYNDLVASIADDLGASIAGIFGPIGDELYAFYQDVQAIQAAATAKSLAEAQAIQAGNTGAAITTAGAQAGVPGAIAMAAILSGLGIASSLGVFSGSDEVAPELGDFADTSDSMANALDTIADVQYPMLSLTKEMTGYLQNISNAFGTLENSLLRADLDLGGITSVPTTKDGFLFGGSSSALYGSELSFGEDTLSDIINSELETTLINTYEKVKTTWYGATSTSYNEAVEDVSTWFNDSLAGVTEDALKSMIASGTSLGIDVSGLINEAINLGTLDISGMSESEIVSEIEARFSAQMDAIAEQYFGAVVQFQEGGEGLAETLSRVTVVFEQVRYALADFGLNVTWETANIISEVAGGLSELEGALSSYTENFFTDQEQYDMLARYMSTSFATLNKEFNSLIGVIPETNDEFRALVESLDTTRAADAALFGELMLLADGFNEMTESAEALNQIKLDEELDKLARYIEFYEDVIGRMNEAFLGSISYLTSAEKAAYSAQRAQDEFEAGNTQGYFDALYSQLEYEKKMTTTREEYIEKFNDYIDVLKDAEPEATTEDVVEGIDELQAKLDELIAAVQQSSYQGAI